MWSHVYSISRLLLPLYRLDIELWIKYSQHNITVQSLWSDTYESTPAKSVHVNGISGFMSWGFSHFLLCPVQLQWLWPANSRSSPIASWQCWPLSRRVLNEGGCCIISAVCHHHGCITKPGYGAATQPCFHFFFRGHLQYGNKKIPLHSQLLLFVLYFLSHGGFFVKHFQSPEM